MSEELKCHETWCDNQSELVVASVGRFHPNMSNTVPVSKTSEGLKHRQLSNAFLARVKQILQSSVRYTFYVIYLPP
jgi:hypothetical protein